MCARIKLNITTTVAKVMLRGCHGVAKCGPMSASYLIDRRDSDSASNASLCVELTQILRYHNIL